ncbi:uncharacterized protein ARMOST_00057 [Armillaria ostoyae]|uniref:Uncharacterized protein n=1 Tax=Armillaria ostoyae TaxID=47428 RepID=A0A284QK34_ARMOS|nr:uncharacterized protein ARMOST_00057 [Armillaria ostoyae]
MAQVHNSEKENGSVKQKRGARDGLGLLRAPTKASTLRVLPTATTSSAIL